MTRADQLRRGGVVMTSVTCTRCRTAPRTRGSYCRECHNAIKRESDRRIRAGLERRRCHRKDAPDCSTPPPPPPGFDVRDLALGRPWG